MKLSPHWLRDFVDLSVDDRRLAEDLTAVGIAVEGTSGSGEATVFEMEIGTNRPDAMNHYGVAREAAAIYGVPLKPIQPKLPEATAGAAYSVTIAEPELCPRFTARIIRNTTIKPSPDKIARRLGLLDQRPINNAVDATNYTLWEMGKPTHVFDMDLLEGGRIVVRRARAGETLKTLDGVERKLTTEDLVVADGSKPVGLAGVMGGFDTMITDKTRNILIESAWWDPGIIRRMSKRHGLHTDASHRFERGADFESTVLSCNRVAELILQSGGGELVGAVADVIAKRVDQAPVELHVSEVHRILGKMVRTEDIFRILDKLGFGLMPERGGECDFVVKIPSWRLDVEREVDLIEEVARLYGYDKFPNTLPAFSGAVVDPPDTKKDHKLRSALLGLGYHESISLTFISAEDAKRFSAATAVELENPQSEESSVMRTSLLPGMLNMLGYNLNRGSGDVRLFEAGNVYEYDAGKSVEIKRIALGAMGSAVAPGVQQPPRPMSFFDLKGDVETLLMAFEHRSLHYDSQTSQYFHPGRSARAVMDGTVMAQYGQVHPEIAAARKLRQDVFAAEVYLDRLYQHDLRHVHYAALPRFPAVERDFSFVFDDAVVFEKIQLAINALRLPTLRSFDPVEIFRGKGVPEGKYSILLRAVFQSNERTLREEEVAEWTGKIISVVEGLGGTLRK